mmetsp:Transcript_53937/g.114593  ORF Transcript_53937/g.114593 Transcript_53937/m.114593 type:complete len:264 (-) Transcript_53937:260-1051(-)|eukprot:CAMPEP_0172529256 /NCGR_PEP_ID=MMETSP1067-20121228/3383_1 /TAXON_ID=265564 ORGANISM="Thalassiosira punctigera, Strain Tpunct2005C2" /NCGR_SAMPLE_ID=MMETSP1067 /ASSEMBLY_ACC=CAM_ASM_000444 /LENGTH=263 /DNA_ID=CAMNT_0013313279 /DNA_START=60 /DNA_END=851 /DNA_ORIENTATION=+
MMVPANDRDLLGPGGGRRHHSMGGGPGTAAIHAIGRIDANSRNAAPSRRQGQHQHPTEDLLGFAASPSSPPQQYEQQQVIEANHATVSITTTSGAAPSIAGIGKIETSRESNNLRKKPKRKAIVVPTYSCNGGFDTKFNHFARHARPSDLHGLLTSEEYEREIRTLNDKIKKSRAKGVDFALLATGPLMVPLAVWGARHGHQVKQKRSLIEEGVWEFNERMGMDGRNVRMVWNRAKVVGGGESYLSIEEAEVSGDTKGSKKFD